MVYLTSDLADAHPDLASCSVQFRIFGKRHRFHGRIRTVRCRTDNTLIRSMLGTPGAGMVLVVDAGGSLECALIGDNMAALGMKNGWEGIIVNGAVRDAVAMDQLEFGIKALGTNPRRSIRSGEGQADEPVQFGGTPFVPGHWLYSDEDGILVAPHPLHTELLATGGRRAER